MTVKVLFRYKGQDHCYNNTFKERLPVEALLKEISKTLPDYNPQTDYAFTCQDIDLEAKRHEDVRTLMSPGTVSQVAVEIENKGLAIPQNASKEYLKISNLAKLVQNPFRLSVFNLHSKHFELRCLHQDVLQSNPELNKLNETSAYCNLPEDLFCISGGEEINENDEQAKTIDYLFLINFYKMEVTQKLPLKTKRVNHSMIFVPGNFVFLVGGLDNLEVEYFSNGQIFSHSKLNAERIDPALILVNDSVLFAFSHFNQNQNAGSVDFFEKINLRADEKTWTRVKPITRDNFNQTFFAVCPFTNDSLIFLGGMNCENGDTQIASHVFNYNTDTLEKTENRFDIGEMSEKMFYPSAEGGYFLITNSYSEYEGQCVVVNKDKSVDILKGGYVDPVVPSSPKKDCVKSALPEHEIKEIQSDLKEQERKANVICPNMFANGIEKVEQAQKAATASLADQALNFKNVLTAKKAETTEQLNNVENLASAKKNETTGVLHKAEDTLNAKKVETIEQLHGAENLVNRKKSEATELVNNVENLVNAKKAEATEQLHNAENCLNDKKVEATEKLHNAEDALKVEATEQLHNAENALNSNKAEATEQLHNAEGAFGAKKAEISETVHLLETVHIPETVHVPETVHNIESAIHKVDIVQAEEQNEDPANVVDSDHSGRVMENVQEIVPADVRENLEVATGNFGGNAENEDAHRMKEEAVHAMASIDL